MCVCFFEMFNLCKEEKDTYLDSMHLHMQQQSLWPAAHLHIWFFLLTALFLQLVRSDYHILIPLLVSPSLFFPFHLYAFHQALLLTFSRAR